MKVIKIIEGIAVTAVAVCLLLLLLAGNINIWYEGTLPILARILINAISVSSMILFSYVAYYLISH